MNSILIIDDEAMNVHALSDILSQDYTVYAERNDKRCVETAIRLKPDLILLDVMMPEISGFEVIKILKANKAVKDIPVIFITSKTSSGDEVRGFSLGAADYITKPFSSAVVKMRVQHQMRITNLLREVQKNSITDALTNIGNRRYFNIQMEQEWERARRQQGPISLIILDIDDFKKFNDAFGHLNGDSALQHVARVIRSEAGRTTDILARWGGEEFAIILPDTPLSGSKKIAERILAAVRDADIILDNMNPARITVSISVHSVVPEPDGKYSARCFVSDADKALFQAKKDGKNRVCAVDW